MISLTASFLFKHGFSGRYAGCDILWSRLYPPRTSQQEQLSQSVVPTPRFQKIITIKELKSTTRDLLQIRFFNWTQFDRVQRMLIANWVWSKQLISAKHNHPWEQDITTMYSRTCRAPIHHSKSDHEGDRTGTGASSQGAAVKSTILVIKALRVPDSVSLTIKQTIAVSTST
jgi:hypothetical protein